jgi:molybdopterin molybdotransferase
MSRSISFDEALTVIWTHARPAPVQRVALRDAQHTVLAEEIYADRDWPPFDRSMVDGYAVRARDTEDSAPLRWAGECAAGEAPPELKPGEALRIFTGAPVPAGADAVVMQERTAAEGWGVRVLKSVCAGQNIARCGEDVRQGQVVLRAGTVLGPAELGVLAFAGAMEFRVRPLPRVAVLSTGNELVAPHETPGPAQIRNSNAVQLIAQCARCGIRADDLGVVRDDPESTRAALMRGLAYDVLITTGGVSVGTHDYVGPLLRELGVAVHFDKVAVKPGKPTTFGTRGETLAFGLPGNPVAAFVCFELFVRTALRARSGESAPRPRFLRLPLAAGLRGGGDRTVFRPARMIADAAGTRVEALRWNGSGHLAALVGIDGWIVQPEGAELEVGAVVDVLPWMA